MLLLIWGRGGVWAGGRRLVGVFRQATHDDEAIRLLGGVVVPRSYLLQALGPAGGVKPGGGPVGGINLQSAVLEHVLAGFADGGAELFAVLYDLLNSRLRGAGYVNRSLNPATVLSQSGAREPRGKLWTEGGA